MRDLPPNMTNFVLPGSAQPSMLFQANLHAAWLVTVSPSSQQCSTVPVNLVGSAQHCAMEFLLLHPSLTQCMYELSSLFPILVHIRCKVCVYQPQILCLFAIFSPVHAEQSPDAICTLDWVLTCSVTCFCALQTSAECVCHFEFTRYAQSPMCGLYLGHKFAFFA